jgi:hypothetical protein
MGSGGAATSVRPREKDGWIDLIFDPILLTMLAPVVVSPQLGNLHTLMWLLVRFGMQWCMKAFLVGSQAAVSSVGVALLVEP